MKLKIKNTLKEKWNIEFGTIFSPKNSDKRYLFTNVNGQEQICKRVTEVQSMKMPNGKKQKVEVQKWRFDKELTQKFLDSNDEIIFYPYTPIDKQVYYYGYEDLEGNFNVASDLWLGRNVDFSRYKLGNCFRTQEMAEQKAKKICDEIKEGFINNLQAYCN